MGREGHLPYQTEPAKSKTLPVFRGMTYNVEILSDVRIQQIISFTKKEHVDFCTLVGTRCDNYDSTIQQDFHLYHFPRGSEGTETYTGITIIISTHMLKGTKVTHKVIEQGRIAYVRLTHTQWDLTIVGSYSPGNHHPESQRSGFYKLLRGFLRSLPTRTTVFLGIDSNAHI